MFNELIEANLNKDAARIDHVIQLLKELRVGWQSMQSTGESRESGQPAPGGGGSTRSKRINLRG